MQALTQFPPFRTEALTRLKTFLPRAGKNYASQRNYDFGPGAHSSVSTLSPYIRHRILTEAEVLQAVIARFSPTTAEKFIQEVVWRTYWKGWLELRPSVWDEYQTGLRRALNDVHTQSGLRSEWEAACTGATGIKCFDHWAQELVDTGYLHNHARMWFASIWIFTLRLPWQLGADFFLRHLLDGDPAANTLGWRWVGGLQTQGKTYLARASNIAKYTEGRFNPEGQLALSAVPLAGSAPPPITPLAELTRPTPNLRTGLLLHPEDMSPSALLRQIAAPVATATLLPDAALSPLAVAPHVLDFKESALRETVARYSLGPATRLTSVADLDAWCQTHALEQIVTPYAPVGPTAAVLADIARDTDVPLVQMRRAYDTHAWPKATHGFFRFKTQIPELLAMVADSGDINAENGAQSHAVL